MALAGAVLGGASEWVWTDAKPTSWPLPYASHYANMPPAGTDGGPTKPCAPHVDWGKATPLPPGSGRQAGLGCSDMKPVRYPVCTEEQVARATRMDAAGEEPVDFNTLRPVALRGYLRRAELMPTGLGWNVRLEASSGHGRCSRITVAARPDGSEPPPPPGPDRDGAPRLALCHGDASVACCVSALVGANEEVIYETGPSPGQICVVSGRASQDHLSSARRDDEASFNQPTTPYLRVP